MNVHALFPELREVNPWTWRFIQRYLYHCLHYPPAFFHRAPVTMWWDFFGSTHRVARACAYAEIAIEDQSDIWARGALRGRFLRWADDKLSALRDSQSNTAKGNI
ncbi:MAG TPA: hypothetical protein PLU30_24525 [Verrucomicrobiae bacterium]|nr:hypothetical protein [Verrucomicrobiae bacterium]